MNYKYSLALSIGAAAAALPLACSPRFTSCDASTPCASGAGGEAGQSAAKAGSAGTAASDTPVATQAGGSGGSAVEVGGEAGDGNAEPILLGACAELGQTVCSGHATAERMACDGSKWRASTACAPGELCDSSNGQCTKETPECVGRAPGETVCRADSLLSCGVDLIAASEGETCAGRCKDGVCQKPVCGDSKVEPGEECDDGADGAGACVKCQAARCGDGAVYAEHEQCDDGNLASGDGCSATCRAEPVALALGGHTTCALSSTGLVKCWGTNAIGELGLGDISNRADVKSTSPSRLSAIDLGTARKAVAISVSGGNTACALLDGGDLKCWGNNKFGQLGTGDTDNRGDGPGEMGDALKPIPLGGKAIGVSAGVDYTCAILEDGGVKCWGYNGFGRLGQENAADSQSPASLAPIKLGRKANAISASDDGVTCALLDDGTVKCWGNLWFATHADYAELGGAVGIGDFPGEISGLPALTFSGGQPAQSLIAGDVSATILSDGSLRLWGTGAVGQLGQPGSTIVGLTPGDLAALPAVEIGSGRSVQSIALGALHVCAVLNGGDLKCWGDNASGQLGLGSSVSVDAKPKDVVSVYLAGRAALRVAAGRTHTCAILDDGTLKCWGLNASGQLGLGDTRNRGDSGGNLSTDTTVDLTF